VSPFGATQDAGPAAAGEAAHAAGGVAGPVHHPVLELVIYGQPAAQGSKRAFRNQHTGRIQQVESSKNVKPWREAVKTAAIERLDLEWVERNGPLLTGPVGVVIVFTFARPKSHYRTGRNAHLLRADAPAYPTTSIDVDKAQRACFDALTDAGVWRDDKQVVRVSAAKTFPRCHLFALAVPGAVIHVYDLPAATSSAPGHER